MHNVAVNPDHINKRFHSILDACYQPGLNDLLTEDEKQSIGRAYYEDGFLDGLQQGETKGKAEERKLAEEKRKSDIKSLIANGISEASICQALSLSSEELAEILK